MAPEIIPTPSGTGVFSSGVPLRPKSRPCKHGGNFYQEDVSEDC